MSEEEEEDDQSNKSRNKENLNISKLSQGSHKAKVLKKSKKIMNSNA